MVRSPAVAALTAFPAPWGRVDHPTAQPESSREALIKALEIRGRLKSGGGSRKSPISRSKCAKVLPFAAVQCASEGHFRPPDTLRPQKGQPLAVLVEIHQCEGRQQPLMVLLDAAVAHLGVLEDLLENAERPLHLGAYAGLVPILALLFWSTTPLLFWTRRWVMSCAPGAA